VLEIPIGIVEHDVRTIRSGPEFLFQRTIKLIELLVQTRSIGLVC
jgi:hypothetical protein